MHFANDIVNVEAARAAASACSDIRCFIPEVGRMRGVSNDVTDELNTTTRIVWDHATSSPLLCDVMLAAIPMLAALRLLPPPGDPKTEDFRWSTVRVLLSGAGHAAWPTVVQALQELDPSAPFSPDESLADWFTALQAAHGACGLPATLLLADLHRLTYTLPPGFELGDATSDGRPVPEFVLLSALFHVLKHSRSIPGHVRVIYRSVVTDLPVSEVERDVSRWTKRLGCSPPRKDAPLRDFAVAAVLKYLTHAKLPRCRPLSELPPYYHAGEWTRLEAAAPADSVYTAAGVRVVGLRTGLEGKVRLDRGDEALALGYHWEASALKDTQLAAEQRMELSAPKTYATDRMPSDLLLTYCPNITLDWAGDHRQAILAIYDALLTLGVVRHYRAAALDDTHPIVWSMPRTPTPAESTNNGATSVAWVVAGTHMPGLRAPTSLVASRAGDHQNNRGLSSLIINQGGLLVDDWKVKTGDGDLLGPDKLQSLATGGEVMIGKVGENDPIPTRLRHIIVANAKFAALPPDLVNRSVFIFCRKPENGWETLDALPVRSGRAALEIRFNAHEWVGWLKLHEIPGTNGAIRYPILQAMAEAFAKHRGLPDPRAAVNAAWKHMGEQSRTHYLEAEASGLVTLSRLGFEGRAIALDDLWHDLTQEEADYIIRHEPETTTEKKMRCLSLRRFVAIRSEYRLSRVGGIAGRHRFRDQLEHLGLVVPTGASDRALETMLNQDVRATWKQGTNRIVLAVPGLQYQLTLATYNNTTPMFTLNQVTLE